MHETGRRRIQVAVLGVCLAGLPIELAVSGAILASLVLVDYLFDPKRMMRGDLEPMAHHPVTTASRASEAGPTHPAG